MSLEPTKPTKAKTLDECETWPTVFAITCHECGGELRDSRPPKCTDCKLGMGAELTAAMQTVIAKASTCEPGSIARRVNPRSDDDTNGLLGKYAAVDPHTRRSF